MTTRQSKDVSAAAAHAKRPNAGKLIVPRVAALPVVSVMPDSVPMPEEPHC